MYFLPFSQTSNFRPLQFSQSSFKTQQSCITFSCLDNLKSSRLQDLESSLSLSCKPDNRLGQIGFFDLAESIFILWAGYQARPSKFSQLLDVKAKSTLERPRFAMSSKLYFPLSVSFYIKDCSSKQSSKFYQVIKLNFFSVKLPLG